MYIKKFFVARKYKFHGSPYDASVPTIFMHIPKTSGVALSYALRHALVPNRAIEGCFDRVLFGTCDDFNSLAPLERRRIYIDPGDMPADRDFVSGHIAFSTILRQYRSANYLTVIREPLSRILSLWLYWRSIPDSYLALLGTLASRVRLAQSSLREFLSRNDVAFQVDNIFVRMLLWPHRLIPQGEFIEPRHDDILLKQACDRLNQFSFTDIIENTDMPTNLSAWLKQPIKYAIHNETAGSPGRPLPDELTPETIDLMETRTRLDGKLWESLASARGMEPDALRRRAILRNVGRYASFMAT